MPDASKEHVGSVSISIGGAAIDPKFVEQINEVKVVNSLTLPDMALIRISGVRGDAVDDTPFEVGKPLEVKLGGKSATSTTSVFKGEIATVEPEFTIDGVTLAARAYSLAFKLTRERKVAHVPEHVGLGHRLEGRAGIQRRPEPAGHVHLGRLRVLPAERRDRLGLHVAARADARLRGRGRRQASSTSGPPAATPAAPPSRCATATP